MIREHDVLVTTDMAAAWLETNDRNWRPLNRRRVLALAADMAADRWVPGTGSIDFDEDNRLADGQHRLAAIIESGEAQIFRVRYGVPLAVIENLDSGVRRTFSDLLRHRGEHQVAALAASISLRFRWGRGQTAEGGVVQPTTPELSAWFAAHPEIREAIAPAGKLHRSVPLRMSVWGAALYELGRIDPVECDSFVVALHTGANQRADSPILALRRCVERQAKSRFSSDAFSDLAIVIKAWNHWLAGSSVQVLAWRRGGSRSEPFPVPLGLDGEPRPVTNK